MASKNHYQIPGSLRIGLNVFFILLALIQFFSMAQGFLYIVDHHQQAEIQELVTRVEPQAPRVAGAMLLNLEKPRLSPIHALILSGVSAVGMLSALAGLTLGLRLCPQPVTLAGLLAVIGISLSAACLLEGRSDDAPVALICFIGAFLTWRYIGTAFRSGAEEIKPAG